MSFLNGILTTVIFWQLIRRYVSAWLKWVLVFYGKQRMPYNRCFEMNNNIIISSWALTFNGSVCVHFFSFLLLVFLSVEVMCIFVLAFVQENFRYVCTIFGKHFDFRKKNNCWIISYLAGSYNLINLNANFFLFFVVNHAIGGAGVNKYRCTYTDMTFNDVEYFRR